ncbi:MAG: hypothetical protein NC099_02070 [Corallococcus sp.]|nr:hypothetical protein [Corallococcus sp.]
MSILGWFFKSKKEMAKPDTKPVRIGKYTVTRHAQHRTAQTDRDLKKSDMVVNLLTKPHAITKVKIDKYDRPSYNRVGKTATTSINPTNNHVSSIRRPSEQEAKKYNLEKRGRKYVKKKESVQRKGGRRNKN